MIHFIAARVNRISRKMSLIKNLIPKLKVLKHHHLIFKPKNPLTILMKSLNLRITLPEPLSDLIHAHIIFLSSNNLIPKCWSKGNVGECTLSHNGQIQFFHFLT